MLVLLSLFLLLVLLVLQSLVLQLDQLILRPSVTAVVEMNNDENKNDGEMVNSRTNNDVAEMTVNKVITDDEDKVKEKTNVDVDSVTS
ncbi:uncharacterized [Tachysurus ichikawai]